MGFLNQKKMPLIIAVIFMLLTAACTKSSETAETLPKYNPPAAEQLVPMVPEQEQMSSYTGSSGHVAAGMEATPSGNDAPEESAADTGEASDSGETADTGEASDSGGAEGGSGEAETPDSETPPSAETPSKPLTGWHTDSESEDKIAYITIDDGPSRNNTPKVLDILAGEGIHATFFVLPHSGVDDLYRRIIDEGHELGNHSYSHVYKKLYDAEDITLFQDDVTAARDFIYDNFGYTTVSFRFPGGAMGRKSAIIEPRKEYLSEIGYRWFDWDLSTGDADSSGSGKNPDILTANVLDNIRGRSKIVILMHDTSDKAATVEALPRIIAGLKELGYSFDVLMNY